MSFNIRFDTEDDAPGRNRWADRADSVFETVRRCSPHIVGFQEALRSQLDDLVAAFPTHQALGGPREASPHGEHVPILVDTSRFEPEESGDFWLSPTPEVAGSIGWDAGNPRHCTWMRVRDRASEHRYAVFNTHLDNWGALARVKATRVIVAKATLGAGLPSIVLGDLNADEDSEPIETFRASGLRDTFRDVHPEERDVQTAHHYLTTSSSEKIDDILCDGRWVVIDAGIIRQPAVGRLPSDHYPVVAELRCVDPGPTD
jgi:endonuclease/exonuclease/phosphatase family metal-dependent hydrolase